MRFVLLVTGWFSCLYQESNVNVAIITTLKKKVEVTLHSGGLWIPVTNPVIPAEAGIHKPGCAPRSMPALGLIGGRGQALVSSTPRSAGGVKPRQGRLMLWFYLSKVICGVRLFSPGRKPVQNILQAVFGPGVFGVCNKRTDPCRQLSGIMAMILFPPF